MLVDPLTIYFAPFAKSIKKRTFIVGAGYTETVAYMLQLVGSDSPSAFRALRRPPDLPFEAPPAPAQVCLLKRELNWATVDVVDRAQSATSSSSSSAGSRFRRFIREWSSNNAANRALDLQEAARNMEPGDFGSGNIDDEVDMLGRAVVSAGYDYQHLSAAAFDRIENEMIPALCEAVEERGLMKRTAWIGAHGTGIREWQQDEDLPLMILRYGQTPPMTCLLQRTSSVHSMS